MTTTQPHPTHARPISSALASLIPWAAFLFAMVAADLFVDYKSTSLVGLVASAPAYLGFVALPSLLPLIAARRGVMWVAVLVVMTAIAAVAGVLVVTTEDAQAGLAVLWVPLLAVPMAGILWIGQTAAERRPNAWRAPGAQR